MHGAGSDADQNRLVFPRFSSRLRRRRSRTSTFSRFAARRLICEWGFCCIQPEKRCQKLPQIECARGAFLCPCKKASSSRIVRFPVSSTLRSASTSSTVGECHTEWTIAGHSRARERTGFILPEIGVVLDAGVDLPLQSSLVGRSSSHPGQSWPNRSHERVAGSAEALWRRRATHPHHGTCTDCAPPSRILPALLGM